jgi:hypothetical protein
VLPLDVADEAGAAAEAEEGLQAAPREEHVRTNCRTLLQPHILKFSPIT